MTQGDRQYPDKVYVLYNRHTHTYTDLDIQHDADRVHMLDDLWFIGFSSALLWKTEHPGYTGEEEAATQDKYYKLVFEAFWGIAQDIKLRLPVIYHEGWGSLLKPDIESDMRSFIAAYEEVIELIEGPHHQPKES